MNNILRESWVKDWNDHFAAIDDPRVERTKRHELIDILMISLCAVISGCDSWVDVEEYGKSKEQWFSTFLSLPNGIPSHDTFTRVFQNINADLFQQCFLNWVRTLTTEIDHLISIDGKCLRGSNNFGESPICIVSAWASDNNIVLGQVKTKEKSNEITAIPELIDIIDVKGAVVSIDAAGCQKNIAKKIVDNGGDYLIALKGNQGNLHNDVSTFLESIQDNNVGGKNIERFETKIEKGHGRIEKRRCLISTDTHLLPITSDWCNMNTLVMIEAERYVHGKSSIDRRFYVSSAKKNSEDFCYLVREHWAIENKLHWVLDVGFDEDRCRVREGNGAQNFATLRHMALNLIKKDKSKGSVKTRRKKAGWDNSYLLQLLKQI